MAEGNATVDEGFVQPDVAGLDEGTARRVLMTVSCRDSDSIHKVENAGQVQVRDRRTVQVMHNGLLIDEGCYYGPWMTQVIRGLAGHHEPQEELIFDAILARLAQLEITNPTIVEFGSFWSYYSMWFCLALAGGRALAMEPDPQYLQIGRRNVELNGLTDRIDFVHGAVGAQPGELLQFRTESTDEVIPVVQHDLSSLMATAGLTTVDLAMIDIQGAETVLLERARDVLTNRRVRFLIVSTHHQAISGDPLTHQRALDLLRECGAHIIAEHTVRESYSGDGLIAATFDPRCTDLTVSISHARAKESLCGEPEYELETLNNEIRHRDRLLGESQQLAADLQNQLTASTEALTAMADRLAATADELGKVYRTKLWRWAGVPRAQYARLRRWRAT